MREWKHAGLDCALRHGGLGAPCGYVGLPKEHPFYGLSYTKVEERDNAPSVHGGITYSGTLDDLDGCYGHGRGLWWLGFDMAHAGDLVGLSCIRTDDECVQETNFFADQLSVIGGEVK